MTETNSCAAGQWWQEDEFVFLNRFGEWWWQVGVFRRVPQSPDCRLVNATTP